MTRYNNCSYDGCDGTAVWKPVVVIMSTGFKKGSSDPIKIKFDTVACMICKNRFTVEDIVDQKGFERISRSIINQGYSAPVQKDMKLEWESLAGGKV